jgi:DNA-binding HxlR family transcriptional regulator
MTQVLVRRGVYRNIPIQDTVFTLVKDYTTGARGGFVTVKSGGFFGHEHDVVRVRVDSIEDIEITGDSVEATAIQPAVPATVAVPVETDDEVMARIEQRFGILDEMTRAAINGDIRAMIVVGPPGVGKSYGVEYQLEKAGLFDIVGQRKVKYEVIKGAMTPIGLYCTLYKHSDPKNVLVFDDCDSILLDDLSLNILKAALDSGKKRRIHWNADSAMLRREGVPDMFDFKGSVIFITNLKFENLRSKKLQDHLEALQSRCHFLDLTLDTMRDRFLRIRQIFRKGDLFVDYDITPEQGEEILSFMDTNKERLREMSLRMALKIADLVKVSSNWRAMAESTCMRH